MCRPPVTRSLTTDSEFRSSLPSLFRRLLLEHLCLAEGEDRVPRRLAASHGLDHGRRGKVVPYDVTQSATLKHPGWPHLQCVLGRLFETVAVVAASVELPPSDTKHDAAVVGSIPTLLIFIKKELGHFTPSCPISGR